MSKHVKILYHLITVKACVYLTKSANNVPKCNAFIQSCRKYRSPEWIQYITLFEFVICCSVIARNSVRNRRETLTSFPMASSSSLKVFA